MLTDLEVTCVVNGPVGKVISATPNVNHISVSLLPGALGIHVCIYVCTLTIMNMCSVAMLPIIGFK